MSAIPAERVTPTDVSRLLGLHTDGAHLVMGMVIVSNAVFTFATANVLEDFDLDFAVGEAANRGLAKWKLQITRDVLGEFGAGVAREEHQL